MEGEREVQSKSVRERGSDYLTGTNVKGVMSKPQTANEPSR